MTTRSPFPNRSRWAVLGTLTTAVALMTACGGSAPASSPTAGPSEPGTSPDASQSVSEAITISVINGSVASLPQVVGIEQGFFEDQGLEAELVFVQGGPELITAIMSRSADFTLIAPSLLMSANAQDSAGQNQAMCAVGGQTRSTHSVMVAEDWPTPNEDADYPELLGDLRGARIGVNQIGAETDRILRAMLADAGIDPETDVTIVASGAPAATVAALQAGQIDALVGFPPTPTFVEQQGLGRMFLDIGTDPRAPSQYSVWPGVCYGTRASTIEERPDVALAYRTAVEDAISWMQDPSNSDALIEVAAPFLSMEPDVAGALLEQILPAYGTEITPEMIDNLNDYLVATEQLEAPAEYSSVVWTP